MSTLQKRSNKGYSKCCYASACNRESAFCNECGTPLTRCNASDSCGGLVEADGFCPLCVSPALFLEPISGSSVSVGGRLNLSLLLQNQSPIGRALFVPNIWYRQKGDQWKSLSVGWESLEANQSNPFSVAINDLDKPGVHNVEFLITVESRWKWRSETFMFVSAIEFVVDQSKQLVVQQNINYAADAPQTGATIYAPIRVESNEDGSRSPLAREVKQLRLTRASAFERKMGIRGNANGTQIKRDAEFRWVGFGESESPLPGASLRLENQLILGRSRTKATGGDTDIRLLARQGNGSLDEEMSRRISRNHGCFYIENGRLLVRAESELGLFIDGRFVSRGETAMLTDGCLVSPLKDSGNRCGLRLRFETEHNEIVRVVVTRV